MSMLKPFASRPPSAPGLMVFRKGKLCTGKKSDLCQHAVHSAPCMVLLLSADSCRTVLPAQQESLQGTLCALFAGQTSTGSSSASVGSSTTDASSRIAAQAARCLSPMALL
jgi:hypothetical protein